MHRIGINYLFSNVNPKHKSESFNAEHPVVTPEKITINDFNCLFFGDLKVSQNKTMFDVEITE